MGARVADELTVEDKIRVLISDVLAISRDRVAAFSSDTPLFGELPELDSLAVASLLTEMEDRLDIYIEDEEVDADMLATFGALVAFAERKTQG
jgi:acyl carrier protein